MSTIVYYNDLWIVGPTPERRRAQAWLARTGAMSVADLNHTTSVFHPALGHEVASTLAFSTPNRSFYGDATTLATRFPGLTVVLAECDEDGEGAGWSVFHGGPITMDHPTQRFDHPSNDPDEVMHAQRVQWHPRALAIAREVPFPDGSPLEQATWRDDGETVARLLQGPTVRPDHPELWWDGLLDAGRRQATWIDLSPTTGQYLDGRGKAWTRSAVDAWAEAFPKSLRDVQHWLDRVQGANADVSTRAAMARWVGPGKIYSLSPLDWPGETPDGVASPNPPEPTRTMDLPWSTDPVSRADGVEHHRLLQTMNAFEREGLLNAWLARTGHLNLFNPNDETPFLKTMERWHQDGLLPATWFESRTIEWLRTATERTAVPAWLERHALRTELDDQPTVNPVQKPRSRL